ncbi:OPT oligopeptide transporter [Panaeolus papilionaceus]|nr:OPT oligopeptide transporter [Panaeolus papilionaceus]
MVSCTEDIASNIDLEKKGDDEGDHPRITSPVFNDPNIDSDINSEFEDDSPYPEVRAAVSNLDDPEIPVSTIRAWVLGLLFAIIIPGLNQFLYMRFPSVTMNGAVAQLLIFPLGRLWAHVVPNVSIFGMPLNPSPFSIKEHVLSTIMVSVGAGTAYATGVIAVQERFYRQHPPFIYQWMVVISTQLIGFSIGGIARRFLVEPMSMIWPSNLVTCALFNTLHSQVYAGYGSRGGLSRERFFVYAFICSAAWYVMPGYLFQALSFFSWVCWIFPKNITVNQLFGQKSGLGMSLLTFDWAQVAYIGSPLATPWWASANIMAGFIFFYWILTPALYVGQFRALPCASPSSKNVLPQYGNVWYSKYLPMSSKDPYDNTGTIYNHTHILNDDNTFNQTVYEEYSPLFISTTFAVSYGLSFASITATLTHALLYFRKQIWAQASRSLHDHEMDVHARLMARYRRVPEWWYAVIFATMFAFGIVSIKVWSHANFPIGWFILSLVIAFFYVIPIGMIQAITNQQIGLNVITELIVGYGLPGRPIAMMMFKTWGYITMGQALIFTSDFKLGHYMKIPPRSMFWAQVIATIVAGTAQLAVQNWMFGHISTICTPDEPSDFICPGIEVFGTASIIWGLIGPARQFSQGQIYYGLLFFFPIGFICPIILYVINWNFPKATWLRYINLPIFFSGTAFLPPASPVNYVSWGVVGFIFQYVIRRRHFAWWAKYNYVLSAALDAGVAISALVIYFCLQFPLNGHIGGNSIQKWWGNSIVTRGSTADTSFTPLWRPPVGEKFGPTEWH